MDAAAVWKQSHCVRSEPSNAATIPQRDARFTAPPQQGVSSMAIITFLAANLVPKFIPERFKQAAVWIGLAAAAIALLLAAKAIYDASVVASHEKDRTLKSIDARDKSAEERADDAVRNIITEKDREDAIRGTPNAGATLAPSTIAANCKRLERAYSASDLEKSQAYKDLCG